MASEAAVPAEPTLFVRKATGLVKGWSVFDAFIYATMSINLLTLGFGYAFTGVALIPNGSLIWSVVISSTFILFEVLAYCALISMIPRAGGDYVWQTRILGGGIGFVFAATGWWFILWSWLPIYANVLDVMIIQPTLQILGFTGTGVFRADWWVYTPTHGTGNFVSSLICAGLAIAVVSAGMRWYARIQRWCFYGGMIGLVWVIVLFLTHSHADFINAFNHGTQATYGAGPNAYQGTLAAGGSLLHLPPAFAVKATFLLIPFIAFFNIYPNWGGTLYGEVRGASDFKKNVIGMGGSLVFVTVLSIIAILAMFHSIGEPFYRVLSGEYWGSVTKEPVYIYPYPSTLASFFYSNTLVQLILIWLVGLWFFGWIGTLFLSSTRMIFAAAFDRILPEWAAKVDDRTHAPIPALLLVLVPSLPIAAAYAWSRTWWTFTLDAALVIVVMYFVTTAAAIVMPWRRKEVYELSPIQRYKIFGVPALPVVGVVFFAFAGFCLYEWLFNDVYFVNNKTSLEYLASLYILAIAVYVISRTVRKRQGINLAQVNSKIPVE
jgi:APA family basic amino acid/polyamine antiporter